MHLIVNYLPWLEILLEHYEHSCGILSMRKLALQIVISTGTHICMQCKPLKKIYQITCTFDQLICKYGNLRYSKGQIFLSATTQILVLILMEKRDVCGRSTTFFTTRKWNELSSLRVEPQGNCQIIVNENNWTIVGISQARQNPSFLTLDGTKVNAVSPIAFWFHFFSLLCRMMQSVGFNNLLKNCKFCLSVKFVVYPSDTSEPDSCVYLTSEFSSPRKEISVEINGKLKIKGVVAHTYSHPRCYTYVCS